MEENFLGAVRTVIERGGNAGAPTFPLLLNGSIAIIRGILNAPHTKKINPRGFIDCFATRFFDATRAFSCLDLITDDHPKRRIRSFGVGPEFLDGIEYPL